MEIRPDDLTAHVVQLLLNEHLSSMHLYSPPESVHALDIAGLSAPDITFWTAWNGEDLLGCGALKELDPTHGEIKSMRTSRRHLRKGVAAAMLTHILGEAAARQYKRVSLETGSDEAFRPAQDLYKKFGFAPCGPFGDYVVDPYSVFMTKALP